MEFRRDVIKHERLKNNRTIGRDIFLSITFLICVEIVYKIFKQFVRVVPIKKVYPTH